MRTIPDIGEHFAARTLYLLDEARDTISMFLLVGKTSILVCHLLMYTMSIDPAVIASVLLN